jgi:hypothetical protein
MTAALDVLAAIRRSGGDVKVVAPDRLKVVAPPALLPDLVKQVRSVKSALLVVLLAGTSAAELHTVASTSDAADGWTARHREAFAHWRALHPEDEATQLAWRELQDRWHKLHGERVRPDLCAGCRRPIGHAELLHLGDGNRVHLDNLNCVIRHGERWRRAATRALVELGLQPPTSEP